MEKASKFTKKKADQLNDPEYRANLKKQSEELWQSTKQKLKLKEEDKQKFMEVYAKASENFKKLDSKEFRQNLNDRLNKALGSKSSECK